MGFAVEVRFIESALTEVNVNHHAVRERGYIISCDRG